MAKGKKMKTKGKTPLSRQFQSLKKGESVAVIREVSVHSSFPERLQGRTGVVMAKRGAAYVVAIKDNDKAKQFIIRPIHLKRIR